MVPYLNTTFVGDLRDLRDDFRRTVTGGKVQAMDLKGRIQQRL